MSVTAKNEELTAIPQFGHIQNKIQYRENAKALRTRLDCSKIRIAKQFHRQPFPDLVYIWERRRAQGSTKTKLIRNQFPTSYVKRPCRS